MWEAKPEGLKLVCAECKGDLEFDVIQGEITVELCDVCVSAAFQQGLAEAESDR